MGLRSGLRLAGLRCTLRHLPVPGGERQPHEIRQPLVDQGHLTVAPGQDPGQHQHGLAGFPALLQGERVRGDQEILVLTVGDTLDGKGQARAKVLTRPWCAGPGVRR